LIKQVFIFIGVFWNSPINNVADTQYLAKLKYSVSRPLWEPVVDGSHPNGRVYSICIDKIGYL